MPRMSERLWVRRFCIPVTLRCNLHCKLCAERSPYYRCPYHPELPALEAQIDRLFTLADGVTMFDITGGEPLLRKDLHQLVRRLYERYGDRVGDLRIMTNGTLVPDGELLESLKLWGERVRVVVDHYAVSRRCWEAAGALEAAGIPFEVRDYLNDLHCDGWVDYGDFSKKHDPAEAKKVFDACVVTKLDFFVCLVDGVLYSCARARLLQERGITREGLDIMTLPSNEEGRSALREFLNRTALESCAYCNGLCENSARFMPAEQLEPGFVPTDE